MSGQLKGKVALVTGGGSGIGRATALTFAREGAKVVVADIEVDGGQATARMIEAAEGEAVFVEVDVSQAAAVKAMVSQAIETYGRLDCAFNNAGILGSMGAATADYPEEAWHQVIGINLTGVWLCMKYEIQQMLKQKGGAIVNTASVMGLVGSGNPAYGASKHGVVGLTKSAALSYSQEGIRVNAVCPGFIDTPLLEPLLGNPQVVADIIARHPIGRLGQPEEVAETVVWLCSDAASFVTGHAMVVDGGYVAK
jgi:NAD(P)-dependent dehydrogenase (short-subunit alcohol dehydrogenase family)